MKILNVLKGKERTGWFGYGRLQKIASSQDESIRSSATERMLERIELKLNLKDALYILNAFDERVVTEQVIDKIVDILPSEEVLRAVVAHPNTSRKLLVRIAIDLGGGETAEKAFHRVGTSLTSQEILAATVRKLQPRIARSLANDPRTGRMALINLLQEPDYDFITYTNAYHRIVPDLTFSEIRFMAVNKASIEAMKLLLAHRGITVQMAAEVISLRIPRSKEVISLIDDGGRLVDGCFAYEWQGAVREEAVMKYSLEDVRQAIELLRMSRHKEQELLRELEHITPELTAEIIRLLSV